MKSPCCDVRLLSWKIKVGVCRGPLMTVDAKVISNKVINPFDHRDIHVFLYASNFPILLDTNDVLFMYT